MNQKKQPIKKLHATTTIDEKHTEMLNYFYELETRIIPNLIIEKKNLKQKLREQSTNKIDVYMDIRDKIDAINKEITELKSKNT